MDSESELVDLNDKLSSALSQGRNDEVRRIAARMEELGRTALQAGDPDQALRMFRDAIEIRDLLDPEDPDVLDLVSQLGFLYSDADRPDEAVSYLRRSLTLRRDDRGSDLAVLRRTIRDLARMETQRDNLAEAEVLYRELVDLSATQAGRALEIAIDQTELAGVIGQRFGPTPEARALLLHASEIHREAENADPASLATTLGRLGLHHQRRGETREALPLFAEALRLRLRALPETAPEIIDALNNVGIAHLELGDLSAARNALERAEALLLASEVPDRYRLVFIDTNLADLDRQTGRFPDSERHARRATEFAKELFGEEHPQTASAMNALALVHQATGRLEDALPLLEAVVRVRRAQAHATPLEEIMALNNLGVMRASLGLYDDAMAVLHEAYERAAGTVGEKHPQTAFTLDNLAQTNASSAGPKSASSLRSARSKSAVRFTANVIAISRAH